MRKAAFNFAATAAVSSDSVLNGSLGLKMGRMPASDRGCSSARQIDSKCSNIIQWILAVVHLIRQAKYLNLGMITEMAQGSRYKVRTPEDNLSAIKYYKAYLEFEKC